MVGLVVAGEVVSNPNPNPNPNPDPDPNPAPAPALTLTPTPTPTLTKAGGWVTGGIGKTCEPCAVQGPQRHDLPRIRQNSGCLNQSRDIVRLTRSSAGTSARYFAYSLSGTCK